MKQPGFLHRTSTGSLVFITDPNDTLEDVVRKSGERRQLRREFTQAQRQMQMLTEAPSRNTLPWDVAFGLFVLGFVGALVVLGLMGVGLL